MDPSSRRYVADPKYPTGLYPKWSNEAVKRALNQIPKNENGNRYKVISLFDGYGHGGGCVCVDPDVPSLRTGNINQQIEPVLLTSWAGGLHKHMYEQIHTIKKWRAVGPNKIGQYKYELNDKDIRKDDIYSFLSLNYMTCCLNQKQVHMNHQSNLVEQEEHLMCLPIMVWLLVFKAPA